MSDAAAAPAATILTAPAETPAVAAPPAAGAPPAPAASLLTTPPTAPPVAGAPPVAPPASATDAAISFKLPDDITANPAQMAEYTTTFKELGLDSAKSQKLVDVWAKQTRAQVQADRAASEAAWTKEQADLQAAVRADPEIGGANLNASMQAAQRALLKVSTPKLLEVLNTSGLGNHPEVIRAFAKLGKLLGEDSVGGAGAGNGAGSEQSALQALKQAYPSMFKA